MLLRGTAECGGEGVGGDEGEGGGFGTGRGCRGAKPVSCFQWWVQEARRGDGAEGEGGGAGARGRRGIVPGEIECGGAKRGEGGTEHGRVGYSEEDWGRDANGRRGLGRGENGCESGAAG